ncbi:anti-sigma factor family protein [Streptomyces beihaiensis]|uniref:Zf-HC2 domain-containing protein n=1 Tax=Streptomyces beihaiensis TaxID=2984495 RepID=A0ABT3U3W5_9ACTN|nr:zf-HC2 domain-containing protein [Streptomyces beihaiensis]MCX3063735.1 zf-HC2 domain-containing protein [Streptomyces beihaiensis]
MTTTDMAEHPEVEELSDLAEGLLSPSRTSTVREHLDGCALCADVYASLAEIRSSLGTLPGPPRMPDDIARRIDAALAAEAFLDALAPGEQSEPEAPASVSRETSTPGAASSSRTADRPAGHAPAAAGPGRKARAPRRRARTIVGALVGVGITGGALALGAVLLAPGGSDSSTAGRAPATTRAASTFTTGTLKAKVADLLASSDTTDLAPATKHPSLDAEDGGPRMPRSASPMRERAVSVPACIQQGTRRTDAPLAAEQGTYQGKRAYLVVLPGKDDPAHRVTAFVVDASCVQQGTSTGTLLYTHSYARD